MSNPVLVTTEFHGVFFGFAEDISGENITLRNARNVLYWPSQTGGFMGLAAEGPLEGSRIGAQVEEIFLRKVTSVSQCTPEATHRWQTAMVYRG